MELISNKHSGELDNAHHKFPLTLMKKTIVVGGRKEAVKIHDEIKLIISRKLLQL